ncbi:hypothetical protein HNP84_002078 [Thermocatellispora tengchongensis]|uniref:Uncharacterized protein n=1 Tax=Thermocatellispora tengchongensis TaxID=1073253 RepID=A0A840NYX5_9ACTN|nr:hypothetical protein [Thermocatellispora tengchongensis]MBB5132362.1 hypothetical protein [Thermocatellispora tengchongensis]
MEFDDEYQDEAAIRDRLATIDRELRDLRGELSRSDDPKDFGDAGSELARIEEQSALIDALESEKARLTARLTERPG